MPTEITVSLKGVDFIVPVTYEWKPRRCGSCHSFGHSDGKCPRTVEEKMHKEEIVSEVFPIKNMI